MNEFDADLVRLWFEELRRDKLAYKEPMFTEHVMDKIKLFCDSLQQDSHVFQMTVQILERYVERKNRLQVKVTDPFLVILTVIYLSGKYTGELSDYKTGSLINLYEKLTACRINNRLIRIVEIDVISTLDRNLPLCSRIDDLKTLLQFYVVPMELKFDLSKLCEQILNFFTLHQMRIFQRLKLHYMQNQNAYGAFISIYQSRLYIPIGVLLCGFQMVKVQNMIDTKRIGSELCEYSRIHPDHLHFLANEIFKEWICRKRQVNK